MKKLSKGQRHKSSTSSTPLIEEPESLLAKMSQELTEGLRASGLTVTDLEPPTDTGKYSVTFVPRNGAPRIKIEMRTIPTVPCPSCGTNLQPDGRCHACWGDVMGLCDTCDGILEDGFLCPTCAPNDHTIPTV
jgi:hypothetical protein